MSKSSAVIRAKFSTIGVCCRDQTSDLACNIASQEMVGYCVYLYLYMCRICQCVIKRRPCSC